MGFIEIDTLLESSDAVLYLNRYRETYKKCLEVEQKLNEFTENRTLEAKLISKYTVTVLDYGFQVSYDENNDGRYKDIPLSDLQEIEDMTSARLTKMDRYIYTFKWLE